jgi:hypothetical protein
MDSWLLNHLVSCSQGSRGCEPLTRCACQAGGPCAAPKPRRGFLACWGKYLKSRTTGTQGLQKKWRQYAFIASRLWGSTSTFNKTVEFSVALRRKRGKMAALGWRIRQSKMIFSFLGHSVSLQTAADMVLQPMGSEVGCTPVGSVIESFYTVCQWCQILDMLYMLSCLCKLYGCVISMQ